MPHAPVTRILILNSEHQSVLCINCKSFTYPHTPAQGFFFGSHVDVTFPAKYLQVGSAQQDSHCHYPI